MTDADWLAAIAAAPDDPLVRLVYADWLDDQGDPRGEQLRLDVELASRADDDPSAEPLRQRLTELVPGTDARWRAAFCRVPVETSEPFAHPRRHPLNVAGPWYTCGGCLSCDVPEREAPDLLAPLTAENDTTHFTRQPRTTAEVERACRAAKVCCVSDLRYGGTDPVVIRMLGNNSEYCDHVFDWIPWPGPTAPTPSSSTPLVLTPPPLWQILLFPESVSQPLNDDMHRRLQNVSVVIVTVVMIVTAAVLLGLAIEAVTP